MPASPTQRTMNFFRKKGWTASVVEYWNAAAQQSVDFLGFGDVFVFDEERHKKLLLQVTSYSNVSARVNKIKTKRRHTASLWVEYGSLIEVWGWKEYPDRAEDGPFKGCRWRPRIVEITGEELT